MVKTKFFGTLPGYGVDDLNLKCVVLMMGMIMKRMEMRLMMFWLFLM